MNERNIFIGIGGIVVVLLLIALFNSGGDEPDVKDLIATELAPVSDAVSSLGSRLEGVEQHISDIRDTVANKVEPETVAAIESRLQEVSSLAGTLGADIESLKENIADAVSSSDIGAVQDKIEELASQAGTLGAKIAALEAAPKPTPAADTSTDTAAAATTEEAAPSAPAGTVYSVGETAIFGDDGLRIFISRPIPDEDMVNVLVLENQNQTKKTLSTGQAVTLPAGNDYCRVSVGTITASGVDLSAVCGDDLPAPEGLTIGETAIFKEGYLRVFVSRVKDDAARLVINMDHDIDLAVGRSTPVSVEGEECRVYLDTVDRGHVTVSSLCGDAVPVSSLTGAGSTVILGDGAARVFVASVSDGTVRYAVNGQTVIEGASGAKMDLDGGCVVTVEDVTTNQASFSYACEG